MNLPSHYSQEGNIVMDFFFALGQFAAFMGLVYGIIVTFANWRESRQFWGDFDPILAYELHPLREWTYAELQPQAVPSALLMSRASEPKE